MGNPFKELEHNKEVPKHIRKKVMGEIAEIKFLIDLSSLFLSNYASVVKSFFKNRDKIKNN